MFKNIRNNMRIRWILFVAVLTGALTVTGILAHNASVMAGGGHN